MPTSSKSLIQERISSAIAFVKKRWPETLSWLLASIAIVFALASHAGWVDRARGLDRVKIVADHYDLSYGPNASPPIYPSDPAWPVLIGLINKYSTAEIPRDRHPLVIARLQALAAAVNTNVPGLAQWTAPTTPMALIYKPWPNPGAPNIEPSDYRIVGSIADLHEWIKRDSDDFHFVISDILLALLSLSLAVATTLSRR